MPDVTVEVKQLVEDVNKGVHALRTELEEVKKSGQKQTTETDQKIAKITDDITKGLQTVQEIQTKSEASEKAMKSIEAALSRISVNGETKETSEEIQKSQVAFDAYLRKGMIQEGFKNFGDPNKPAIEIRGLEKRSMSTDVNPDGGYLVLPELANFMVQRVFETSPIRRVARVVTTQSKSLEVPIDDNEAEARWVGEGASGGETDTPEVGKLTITAHKIEAEPKVTTEMLEDPYVDVEAWLRQKVTDKFSRTENTAFVQGNNVGRPQGFMTLSNWAVAGTYERNKIEQIALGNASALTGDGLIALQAALQEVYQGRATWLMKRATFGAALALKGSDNYFFSPTLLRDGQSTLTLLGKPVIFCDDVAAVGSNALAVAYGDFSTGYTIVDRVGIQVLRDPFTSKGFVKYYTTKRTGGAVTNFESIKIGKVATSV